jgi:hypothetical protein
MVFINIFSFPCMAEMIPGSVLYTSDFSKDTDGWLNTTHVATESGLINYERDQSAYHHYAARSRRITVEGGTALKYEANINISPRLEANAFWLWLVEFDAAGKVVQTKPVQSSKITGTNGWQTLAVVWRLNSNTKKVELRMSNWGKGTVSIRSVSLYKLAKDSFDYLLTDNYAGTLQEQKIVNDWSLGTSGNPVPAVSLIYKNLPEGTPYAIRAVWQNQLHPDGGFSIKGSVEDGRWPRLPRRLESLSLRVRVEHLQGNLALRPLLARSGQGDSWQGQPVLLSRYSDAWEEVVFKPENFITDFGHIEVSLKIEGGKGEIALSIADVRLRYDDGTASLAFQEWKDLYWYYPRLAESIKPPAADSLYRVMHGSGAFFARTGRGRRYLLKMKEAVPNLGIQSVLSLEVMLACHNWFVDNDIALGYQNATPYLWQAAVERDALSTPASAYESLADLYHKIDYTSEGWRDIYREVARRFSRYGISEYQLIDGHYITSARQSDRHVARVLEERDNGVLLANANRIHFWDYFQSYTGKRWLPADVGLQSWGEYKGTPKGDYTKKDSGELPRKRGYLDMALRHYDYMRWHADVGQIFKDSGILYLLMNNGDDWNTANDWLFNASTQGITGFVEETFFYHPNTVLKAYPLGLAFRDVYERSGTHHRLIAELGKGGHGLIYWSPETAYAMTFAIAASKRYQSLEIDWPDETDWDTQANPANTYHYDRLCSFLARSYAYNNATLNRSWNLASDMERVVSLQDTGAMYAGPYREKLADMAERENYPVSRARLPLFARPFVQNARILIIDNYALPAGTPGRLLEWLDSRAKRALVLHGASAGRRVDGTNWSQAFGWENAINAADQFGNALGSITRTNAIFHTEKKGRILLKDKDGPLLSLHIRPSGSRIYYYHRTPGSRASNDRMILEHIYAAEGISRLADTKEGEVAVYPFIENRGELAIVALNRKQMNAWQWSQAINNMQIKTFPWRNGGDRSRFRIQIPASGDYTVINFLEGTEQNVVVRKNEPLELEMDGINANVFHIVPANNKNRLDELRQQRELFFRWLDKRTNRE